MITWTLIVFFAWNNSLYLPALNVPGFTTTDACAEAATLAQAAALKLSPNTTVSTVCLPSRSQ